MRARHCAVSQRSDVRQTITQTTGRFFNKIKGQDFQCNKTNIYVKHYFNFETNEKNMM